MGAFGLIFYTLVLAYFVGKTVRASQGLSLALFILLICKSISEVPLSLASMSPDLPIHMLQLAVLARYYVPVAQQRAEKALARRHMLEGNLS